MLCPRLCDYLAIVGCSNPTTNPTVFPESVLLRCFPSTNHPDFALPKDVVYFCQPEGCIAVPKCLSDVGSTSFVFALTDKDSGKVRFGICFNYYKPYPFLERTCVSNQSPNGKITDETEGKEEQYLLTSLCLISHHPFLSKFREFLHVLKRLVDASEHLVHSIYPELRVINPVWHRLVGGSLSFGHSMDLLVQGLVKSIELWIVRLLSTPAPLPGRSCVQLTILPSSTAQPMIFALPDKTRFSLVDFPLHLPLELLGVNTCLKILTAIMLEQKVLLQSRDYNSLTMSVMAFISMLYPLQYMFPAIPLLPASLEGAENLLLSPTPYVIGIPATFLSTKKQFLIPPDVWLVDLDTNRMLGSSKLEAIPSLPLQEGHKLISHLEHTLTTMYAARPIGTTDNSKTDKTTGDKVGLVKQTSLIVDDADVATRVAMVRFFNSPDVLANLSEHTRTIRLYPRPVVALQHYSFLKSRQHITPFIQRLAQTQAVEFFSEWSLYPENEVFQRIHAGITDPELIGDKAKWFAFTLPQIRFDVWSDEWCHLLSLALQFADVATPNVSLLSIDPDFLKSISLIDSSSVYRPPLTLEDQLSGAVQPNRPVHVRKKTRPNSSVELVHENPADQFIDSKALAQQATMDIEPVTPDSSDDASSELDSLDIRSPDSEPIALTISAPNTGGQVCTSATNDSCTLLENVPTTYSKAYLSTDSPKSNHMSPSDVEYHTNTQSSGMEPSQTMTSEDNSQHEEEGLEEVSVGKILINNFTDNLADVASQASSTIAEFFSSQKDIVQLSGQFALRVVDDLKSDSSRSSERASSNTQSTRTNESFPGSKLVTKLTPKRDRMFSGKSLFNRRTNDAADDSSVSSSITDPDLSSKAQAFLRDVVGMVIDGKRLNATDTTQLLELLKNENYRSYLMSKIRAHLDVALVEPVTNMPDIALSNRNVYDALSSVVHCMVRGLESSCTNHGIGGLASAAIMLEICHTHYIEPVLVPANDSSSHKRLSKQSEDDLVGAFAGWFRSTAKDLHPKLSSPDARKNRPEVKDTGFRKKFTGQVAGFWSRANRFISPRDNDLPDSEYQTGKTTQLNSSVESQVEQDRINTSCVPCNREESVSEEMVNYNRTPDHGLQNLQTTVQPRSRLTSAYQFINGCLVECDDLMSHISDTSRSEYVEPKSTVYRVYLFEELLRADRRSRLWDHMQFWEDAFFDFVAQERDILGLDHDPTDMLGKFSTLSAEEKKIWQNYEDRLLSTSLYNFIAFMVMMRVDKKAIRNRIRRIQARCRLTATFADIVSHLLDQLHLLEGNSIALIPTTTRLNYLHSTCVRNIARPVDVFESLEVYEQFVLLRDLNDAIVNYWTRSNLLDVQLSSDEQLLQFTTLSSDGHTMLESFQCSKPKVLLDAIRSFIAKNSPKH